MKENASSGAERNLWRKLKETRAFTTQEAMPMAGQWVYAKFDHSLTGYKFARIKVRDFEGDKFWYWDLQKAAAPLRDPIVYHLVDPNIDINRFESFEKEKDSA